MKQITVVVDDHPGALAEITRALAVAGINIETLSGELVESSGVITVAVDRYDEALVALRDAGFSAVSEDALVVRLDDSPGALARIAHLLAEAGVNATVGVVAGAIVLAVVTLVQRLRRAA